MRSLDVIDAVLDLATPVLELIDLEFGVTEEDKLKLESVVRCAEVLLNTHLSEAAKRRIRLVQIKRAIEQCRERVKQAPGDAALSPTEEANWLRNLADWAERTHLEGTIGDSIMRRSARITRQVADRLSLGWWSSTGQTMRK